MAITALMMTSQYLELREEYNMTSAVETMAYAGQVPWHGIGNKVDHKTSPLQMMKDAGCDWKVDKRPIQFIGADKKVHDIKGEFALVRESDNSVLDMVGAVYRPVQNEEVFTFFKEFCDAGKMQMETAGSLWNGRFVWALAKVNKAFQVGKGDEVRPYLLLMSPHIHGKALLMQYTAIRVVCWNTLNLALGAGLRGDGSGFRMPHSRVFKVEKEVAKSVLGLVVEQTEQFKEASIHLSKKKATPEQIDKFFCQVLDFDPKEKDRKVPVALPKFRDALERAPGAALGTAKGTWWGALNAVTYVIDHETGKDRQTALKNAWVGNHMNTKRDALRIALELAK